MRILPLGLFELKNGGLAKRLKGKEVTLAVEGSRQFRPPAALGGLRYEGCEIMVFNPAITLDRASFMRDATATEVRSENIAGLKVAVFEELQENDVWTTFVGFPRNNIVLVATNKDYLRTVLVRNGPCLWAQGLAGKSSRMEVRQHPRASVGVAALPKTERGFGPNVPIFRTTCRERSR